MLVNSPSKANMDYIVLYRYPAFHYEGSSRMYSRGDVFSEQTNFD